MSLKAAKFLSRPTHLPRRVVCVVKVGYIMQCSKVISIKGVLLYQMGRYTYETISGITDLRYTRRVGLLALWCYV